MELHRAWTNSRRSLAVGLLLWTLAAVTAEAQQIQVTSANPPAAEQGTVNLDVTVGGKGFKNGATARFVLSGTDDSDGIVVNRTTFVNPTTLVANITVADTATIAKFDIKVRNSDGRIGKGTELFSVLAKGSGGAVISEAVRASFASVNGIVPYALRSDGNFTNLCGSWDYVDQSDTCTGLAVPNDQQAVRNIMSSSAPSASYYFRQVPYCCSGNPPWDPWIYRPTRWVVLDFSNSGGPCLNIDQTIADHASTNGSGASPPLNPDACVDYVVVQLRAGKVFSKTTKSTSFSMRIDEPQCCLIWNEVYTLAYVNEVPVTHNADGTVTLRATGSSAQAQLLDLNNVVVATYNMPFSMTLQRVK